MDARYAMRTTPWLVAYQVAPTRFEQVIPRVPTLMEPFVDPLCGPAAPQQATTSVRGLLSDVERTHVAAIAEPFGQDRVRVDAPSAYAQSGPASVGGRLGKGATGHVARSLGYVSRKGHT